MKILFISHQADRTGAPIALIEIIRTLKEKSHIECDILLLKDGELRNEFAKYGKVHAGWNKKNIFHKIGRKLGIKAAKYHYLSVARTGHYDLVYANTIASFYVAAHIKEQMNIPFVMHMHESSYLLSQACINSDDLRKCEQIVTVSQFAADALVKDYGIPQERIIVVHPFSGLTKALLCEETIAPHHRKGKFNIGLAGSGYWVKSIDRLPILMEIFFRKYPNADCKFTWVGEIDAIEKYKLMFELRKLGLEDRIELTGKVNEPRKYYSLFDVFLLLSREDSFPLVTLENAALCNPILCFENGSGAVEWVRNGAGEVVPYMQMDTLANRIYMYYEDDDLKCKIGAKAREIVDSLYYQSCEMTPLITYICQWKKEN